MTTTIEARGGIASMEDAIVPRGIPGVPGGKPSKKIKNILCADGTTIFGCTDCNFTGLKFNSVAAHRQVHKVRTMGTMPLTDPSSIKGTHLEKMLIDEVTALVDKVTFSDRSEVRRLSRELNRTKATLATERAARRKAERSLKRIKAAI